MNQNVVNRDYLGIAIFICACEKLIDSSSGDKDVKLLEEEWAVERPKDKVDGIEDINEKTEVRGQQGHCRQQEPRSHQNGVFPDTNTTIIILQNFGANYMFIWV
eukprot:UN34344